jgi:hypothetical protein
MYVLYFGAVNVPSGVKIYALYKLTFIHSNPDIRTCDTHLNSNSNLSVLAVHAIFAKTTIHVVHVVEVVRSVMM